MPFNAQRHGNPPLTPAWALECWLWEDDVNTAQYVDTLLDGYKKHDIPVRTILIDSPWSTRYNDFTVDEELYPEPELWFNQLQDSGYRVVLWMTSMVNSYSKDTRLQRDSTWFEIAKEKEYLTGGGHQIKWWKGKGGFIDYTNPKAKQWWQGLQQKFFDWGIDGWKLDGTATLFRTNLGPVPFLYQKSSQGLLSTRKYMDLYYREEYKHGLSQDPEFVTLSRSMDRSFHPEGFAPIDAAPVTWVGDQEHKWLSKEILASDDEEKIDIALDGIQGFESAIQSILKSADKGYNIIGSDVAGFSGSTIPPRLYIRWAQFSTFCGLFLNGGHGDRQLWKRAKEELEIIRQYSWWHTELVPYMYSYVVQGHQGGQVLQRSVEGKYHYMFGDHLLIAPIYKDELENEIHLPKGEWRYWFEDKELLSSNSVFTKSFLLEEYPVYIKEGAIIPMNIKRAYTGIGDSSSADFTTWLIYPDQTQESTFTLYDTDTQAPTTLLSQLTTDQLLITLSGNKISHILKIHLATFPKKVMLDDVEIKDFEYNSETQKLVIRTNQYDQGVYKIMF